MQKRKGTKLGKIPDTPQTDRENPQKVGKSQKGQKKRQIGTDDQAVLQGVPLTGVQVLRWKTLILLHEKSVQRTSKNEVELTFSYALS